mgnify:CR=1 FL=1
MDETRNLALAGEAVDDPLAAAIGIHQPRPAQDLQMPRSIGEGQAGPGGQILDAALALGEVLQQFKAVRMTKRLLREGQMADLKNILEMSAAMQSLAHNTRDNDEAINAFIEKRAPVFTGE